MTTYQTFSLPKQLIDLSKDYSFKLFTDSYPMPLIEAYFIYITILLLGTLDYVWSDQAVIRTITKIFTLPKWSLTSKVHNLHTIWPMPITDKISHLSSPQTAKDSQDAILNSQTCLYTNLLLMTLLELGFTHTSSCGCNIQMCEPQQLYYNSCICTILCACMCLHDDMQA